MTAVASPPNFSNINRSAWGADSAQSSLNSMNPDEVRGMFAPRKNLQRTNSASSVSSNSSNSSTSTIISANGNNGQSQTNGNSGSLGEMNGWQPRKRPQPKAPWPAGKLHGQQDFSRASDVRTQMNADMNGATGTHQMQQIAPSQTQSANQASMQRPMGDPSGAGQPVLYLLSLNGTFERKTISVPYIPETLRIGRQTNVKTLPTPTNGFFDSKVLSRQHAEIWADRNGKIWIRDVKSSNGTFVNGARLSQENRESEPHELQTSDHLELGIDIVSEDQKSVVHHKVAAKVEHAGYLNHSNNLLDMSFGDLDPTNGMMLPQGSSIQPRGRLGSHSSLGASGRLPPGSNANGVQGNGMAQRGYMMPSAPSTELIVKKLQQEMRNARLQSQDLGRTNEFLHALLSKEDLKAQETSDGSDPKSSIMNGNSLSFRSDSKPRFSGPPAPPPQQPLPEKPDAHKPHSSDVAALKRATTERPKSHPANGSPVRQENTNQIMQLTEALSNARKEIDTHTARIVDLEEMVRKEREARELVEEENKRLEDMAASRKTNGSAFTKRQETVREGSTETFLETIADASDQQFECPGLSEVPPEIESVEFSANLLQTRLESMVSEMKDLRTQLEVYKHRAETAEAERDADRKTLAEMVVEIRQRDDLINSAPRSRGRSRSQRQAGGSVGPSTLVTKDGVNLDKKPAIFSANDSNGFTTDEKHYSSRANTLKADAELSNRVHPTHALLSGLPYASMVGVVILGMGLMVYINGWQPPPRVEE